MPDLPAPQKALSAEREREAELKAAGNFKSFAGGGQRLDGKELKSAQAALLEAMPKQPSPVDQAKIWQSRGMSCAGDAAAKRAAAATPAANGQAPPKPVFRKPTNAKWAKTNKAAFSGSGNSLK